MGHGLRANFFSPKSLFETIEMMRGSFSWPAVHVVLTLGLLAVAVPAEATHGNAPPDATIVGVWVDGVVFHDLLGMCHLGASCPFPWEVPGNFVGTCEGGGPGFIACTGTWVDLWFEFNVGGGAAYRVAGPNGPIIGGADTGELIHIRGMQGIVAMSCAGEPPEEGPQCATNFTGQTVFIEQWSR